MGKLTHDWFVQQTNEFGQDVWHMRLEMLPDYPLNRGDIVVTRWGNDFGVMWSWFYPQFLVSSNGVYVRNHGLNGLRHSRMLLGAMTGWYPLDVGEDGSIPGAGINTQSYGATAWTLLYNPVVPEGQRTFPLSVVRVSLTPDASDFTTPVGLEDELPISDGFPPPMWMISEPSAAPGSVFTYTPGTAQTIAFPTQPAYLAQDWAFPQEYPAQDPGAFLQAIQQELAGAVGEDEEPETPTSS